ncbi:MAG: hypothetical protein DMD86_03850 [Candidatus Rokuibacteriota bacterium]|jgi:hypothetical protein|nr:MAG: hypothetical protein DMD86_03850 [Candidatus Rokubacteria bacterium]
MRIRGDLAAFVTTRNAGPFLLTLGAKAGARRAGFRTLTIARTRDPILISQLDVSDAGTRPSPAP